MSLTFILFTVLLRHYLRFVIFRFDNQWIYPGSGTRFVVLPCCPRGGAARAGRVAGEKRVVGRMRCAHGRVMVAGEGRRGVSLSRKLYDKQPFRFSCSGNTHRSLSVQNAFLPPPHRVGRPMIRASLRDDSLFAWRIQSFRAANAIFSHGDYYLIARPKLRSGGAKRAL